MLIEVYYLITTGTFDREPTRFLEHPTSQEIERLLIQNKAISARIEKRYELFQSSINEIKNY